MAFNDIDIRRKTKWSRNGWSSCRTLYRQWSRSIQWRSQRFITPYFQNELFALMYQYHAILLIEKGRRLEKNYNNLYFFIFYFFATVMKMYFCFYKLFYGWILNFQICRPVWCENRLFHCVCLQIYSSCNVPKKRNFIGTHYLLVLVKGTHCNFLMYTYLFSFPWPK